MSRPSRLGAAGIKLAFALAAAVPVADAVAAAGDAPVLTGVASRKQHGAVGAFDLPASLAAGNPTTESRAGPAYTLVFTFDKPVTAGVAAVTEGTATAGDPTFSGNEMIVPLTGVANAQYVSVAVARVRAADGGTGGRGSVRLGLLAGDASQNRVVTVSDQALVHAQVGKTLDASNYPMDVDANGIVNAADETAVIAQLTASLPAPPATASNQPPQVYAGPNQSITLPGSATLAGSAGDDGRPSPPGALTLAWSKISGPGTVTFGNASAAATTASFSAYGSYVLRLTADDGALSNFSDVTVDAGGTGATTMSLTITGFPGAIGVVAFDYGAFAVESSGGGASRTNFNEATFDALEDPSAPVQLAKLAAGTTLQQALLEVRSASGQLLSSWKFQEVRITSLSVTGIGLDVSASPRTHFTLGYASFLYTIYNANGTTTQMGWDLKRNVRF